VNWLLSLKDMIDRVCSKTFILSLSGLTPVSSMGQAPNPPFDRLRVTKCHGELVEPWIPRSSRGMTDYIESVYKVLVSKKTVILAKAGIHFFQ